MNAPKPAAAPGYVQQTRRQIAGVSTFYKVIFATFFIVIVGILIYWGVTSRSTATLSSRMNPILISQPIPAFNSTASQQAITLPVSNQGMEFTYSMWLYIADWSFSYGMRKYIIIKGNLDGGPARWAPAIWLGEKTNTLHTSMAIFPAQTNPFGNSGNGTPGPQYEECLVSDIPLQKWVHLCYILNTRNTSIYVDGKLVKSCMLDGVPDINNQPLHITPRMPEMPGEPVQNSGFFGQISSFQYFTRALEPNEVSDIYFRGPYSAS